MNRWGALLPAVFLSAGLCGPARCDPAPSSEAQATELNNRGVLTAKKGEFEEGISLIRQAAALNPGDPQFRANLSGALTDWAVQLERSGQTEKAKQALQEAVTSDPENGKALISLANLAFQVAGDLEQAVALWKKAYGKVPSSVWPSVAEDISRAERDLVIERGFEAVKSEHFRIRLEGSPHWTGAGVVQRGKPLELAQLLEREYRRLSETLGARPEGFSVIVYSAGSFRRVAGRRDWATGFYDGRIRLRLDEIGNPWTEAVVAHELAHAFLAKTYGPRVPVWVHEGFAQLQETSRGLTPQEDARLAEVRSKSAWVPLHWLDQRFQQPLDLEDVERCYLQARWTVDSLIRKAGAPAFRSFLDGLKSGASVEQAFDQSFAPLTWAKSKTGNFD